MSEEQPSLCCLSGEPEDNITIDSEFQALIPPLTSEERAGLEVAILRDGCRDPLVVWATGNILLDGHNRVEICRRHRITFEVKTVALDSREHAKLWIEENQTGRRNLSDDQRAMVWASILERRTKLSRAAQLQQARAAKTDPTVVVGAKTAPTEKPRLREQVASLARLPEKKLRIARAVLKNPELARQVRAGEFSLRQAKRTLDAATPPVEEFVHFSFKLHPWEGEALRRIVDTQGKTVPDLVASLVRQLIGPVEPPVKPVAIATVPSAPARPDIKTTLQLLSKVVSRSMSIPVLTCVLLDGDAKLAAATDFNHSMQVPLPPAVTGGRTLVPLWRLKDILRTMDGDTSLDVDATGVTIKNGDSTIKIPALAPPENFPKLETMPEGSQPIPLAKLQTMVSKVSFAAHQKAGFGKLPFVLVEAVDGKAHAVATDGHRLAIYTDGVTLPGIFRPLIGLSAIEPLGALSGETAQFAETDSAMYFKADNAFLIVRKLNAMFPKYRGILPTTFTGKVTVLAGDLQKAVETAVPILDPKYKKVVLKVDPFTDSLTVFGQVVDGGANAVSMIPARVAGEAQDVGFNAGYLLEFLRGVEGEVVINLNGPESGAEIRSGDFRYLLMPLK